MKKLRRYSHPVLTEHAMLLLVAKEFIEQLGI